MDMIVFHPSDLIAVRLAEWDYTVHRSLAVVLVRAAAKAVGRVGVTAFEATLEPGDAAIMPPAAAPA